MGGAGGPGGCGACGVGGGASTGGSLTEKLLLGMLTQNQNTGMMQQSSLQGNNSFGVGFQRSCTTVGPYGQERHSIVDSHPKFKTKLCRYFAMGNCKNGDRCTFLHDMSAAAASGEAQQFRPGNNAQGPPFRQGQGPPFRQGGGMPFNRPGGGAIY